MIARWTLSIRCRRCAVFDPAAAFAGLAVSAVFAISAALIACDASPERPVEPNPVLAPAESRLAGELTHSSREQADGFHARYWEGYVADTVQGDLVRARAAYESVIAEAGSEAPELAARAALRLAELEALAGRRRQAIELMARASVLGRTNLAIVEQADQLHERLGSLRAAGSEVRGPPLGTELDGVSEHTRELFAEAENLLAAYHETRLRPRLEQLRASIRKKESTMDAAVRAYRQVTVRAGSMAGAPAEPPAESMAEPTAEPLAQTAAEFRVASLHHDLALSLMFDLPPELEPRAAAKLQRSLRTSAIGHLDKARTAYRRTLEYSQARIDAPGERSVERWSAPATLALRSVEDLLGGEP